MARRYESDTVVSVMPEIIALRKEWKKKFGDTRVFDDFYMGLRDKIVAHHIQSMKEWQEDGGTVVRSPSAELFIEELRSKR